jgi:hypothetical protein
MSWIVNLIYILRLFPASVMDFVSNALGVTKVGVSFSLCTPPHLLATNSSSSLVHVADDGRVSGQRMGDHQPDGQEGRVACGREREREKEKEQLYMWGRRKEAHKP